MIRLFGGGCRAGRKGNGSVDRDVHSGLHTLVSYSRTSALYIKKKGKSLQIVEWNFTRSEFVDSKIQISLCTPSRNLSRYLIQRQRDQPAIQFSRDIQLRKTAVLECHYQSRRSSPRCIYSYTILRWDGVLCNVMSPHMPDLETCRIVIHGGLIPRRGGGEHVELVVGGGGSGQ